MYCLRVYRTLDLCCMLYMALEESQNLTHLVLPFCNTYTTAAVEMRTVACSIMYVPHSSDA